MALTVDYKEGVLKDIRENPEVAREYYREAMTAMVNGENEVASRGIPVNAIGFDIVPGSLITRIATSPAIQNEPNAICNLFAITRSTRGLLLRGHSDESCGPHSARFPN